MTGTSSQTCNICGCKPIRFNDIDSVKTCQIKLKIIDSNYLLNTRRYGFEYCLNLASRLELKT